MRVLILGGDGYLGWPTAMAFARGGHEVCVMDNYLRRNIAMETSSEPLMPSPNLNERAAVWKAAGGEPIRVVIGDCKDYRVLSSVFEEFSPEAVIHHADLVAPAGEGHGRGPSEVAVAGKMRTVPLPLPAFDAGEDPSPVFPEDGKIRLVFTGNLYRSIRDPRYLLSLFRELSRTSLGGRLELHFFGNLKDCVGYFEPYEALIGTKIFTHGLVPRERALRAVVEADIVVNIANATPYQLPSKVMEYASAGKPILNLAKVEDDSSVKFLRSYPAALNLVARTESPTPRERDRVVGFLQNPPLALGTPEYRAWVAPYLLPSVAGAYEEMLEGDR